jgi:hypothetical protein
VLGNQLTFSSVLAVFTYISRPLQGTALLAAIGEAYSSDVTP